MIIENSVFLKNLGLKPDSIHRVSCGVSLHIGMISFKDWLIAQESSSATRHALGSGWEYPPSPEDFITRPPYGKMRACGAIGKYKTYNIDVSKICGKKDSHKPKSEKPKKAA